GCIFYFFFSSRRRHTRFSRDWSSDVCSSDLIYTNERNGLDIIVRRAEDRSPVSHLEGTMMAEIFSPDGSVSRVLPLRAVFGQEGRYTADIVLTEPGVYTVRLWGYILDVEFDELFHTHEVSDIA